LTIPIPGGEAFDNIGTGQIDGNNTTIILQNGDVEHLRNLGGGNSLGYASNPDGTLTVLYGSGGTFYAIGITSSGDAYFENYQEYTTYGPNGQISVNDVGYKVTQTSLGSLLSLIGPYLDGTPAFGGLLDGLGAATLALTSEKSPNSPTASDVAAITNEFGLSKARSMIRNALKPVSHIQSEVTGRVASLVPRVMAGIAKVHAHGGELIGHVYGMGPLPPPDSNITKYVDGKYKDSYTYGNGRYLSGPAGIPTPERPWTKTFRTAQVSNGGRSEAYSVGRTHDNGSTISSSLSEEYFSHAGKTAGLYRTELSLEATVGYSKDYGRTQYYSRYDSGGFLTLADSQHRGRTEYYSNYTKGITARVVDNGRTVTDSNGATHFSSYGYSRTVDFSNGTESLHSLGYGKTIYKSSFGANGFQTTSSLDYGRTKMYSNGTISETSLHYGRTVEYSNGQITIESKNYGKSVTLGGSSEPAVIGT
jgi:hypothetical protein